MLNVVVFVAAYLSNKHLAELQKGREGGVLQRSSFLNKLLKCHSLN